MQKREFNPDQTPPLDGVRVLDLCRLVSGNMLTHQLADFGCEVIKIEPAGKGDPLRAWTQGGVDTFWKAYCRNKKSLAMDFRKEGAAEVILKLCETAQVLVENFRPGRLEEMGLGPDVLHARNPKLTANGRDSVRWSRECRVSPTATAFRTVRRCCRRSPWPT
jgi:crotonobetainyl-CoA:carnitine CoA-transferase CaiB-like acyl-CoA transferase